MLHVPVERDGWRKGPEGRVAERGRRVLRGETTHLIIGPVHSAIRAVIPGGTIRSVGIIRRQLVVQ